MGFKIGPDGKVCCQRCDGNQNVKVYGCPFKYCEPAAVCADCAKALRPERSKEGHRLKGCETEAGAALTRQRERLELIKSGEYLLAASASGEQGMIHAIFRSGTKKEGRLIPAGIFKAVAVKDLPSLSDFEAASPTPLQPAAGDFTSQSASGAQEKNVNA